MGSWFASLLAGLLAGLLAAVVVGACAADDSTAPPPADRAARALADHGPQGIGELPGGRFRFGRLIPGGDAGGKGRVATASWDVYWTLDTGDRGAWGVGIDVFGSASEAAQVVADEGAFWCPTESREVAGIADDDLDAVVAVSCRRLGGEGYYATLDVARGPVTANITVARPTRAEAEAALLAVWAPVHDAAAAVAEDVS